MDTVAIDCGSIWSTQFHSEKSLKFWLALVNGFLQLPPLDGALRISL